MRYGYHALRLQYFPTFLGKHFDLIFLKFYLNVNILSSTIKYQFKIKTFIALKIT